MRNARKIARAAAAAAEQARLIAEGEAIGATDVATRDGFVSLRPMPRRR